MLILTNAGSIAVQSNDVAEKPFTGDPWRMKPSELIKNWLEICISDHDLCQISFTGEPLNKRKLTIVPRRLIQTFTRTKEGMVEKQIQLVQTSPEFSSSYVALSHCWGPPNKRPIRTTKSNLDQHLVGIALQNLPQTFRDSVSLCVELGIQYLWIDSLCIVQDDEDEWKQESTVMGSIYENALFTIAASSAVDSSQGLFGVKSKMDLVEIPYSNVGDVKESVFAYIEPDLQKILSSAPLAARAWVMQEYVLSRRIVHFTSHGMIWSCHNDENPGIRYMSSEFSNHWKSPFEYEWNLLVSNYSRRQLTYKSDKLVAINGLANRFQQKHGKTYCCGLWIENLPHDLLWFSDERLFWHTGSDIPSWSWASVTGPISFKSAVFDSPESVCGKVLPIQGSPGYLTIESSLKLVDCLHGPLQCQAFCFEDLRDMDFTGRMQDDYRNGHIKVSPTYLLLSGADKIGWGVFDEYNEPNCPVFCCPLLKQQVWEGFALSKEKQFLWTLLVCTVDGLNKFRRVGWGLILVPSWLDGIVMKDICLV